MEINTPPVPTNLSSILSAELDEISKAGLRRSMHAVRQRHAGTVQRDGEIFADFASNDYLGLASDPRLARAAWAVLEAEGTGAGAARLISGNHPLHIALENELARFKHCESALLFPSGYMANTGTIPALVGKEDVVYSDALNHASLIDGCRLAQTNIRVFPHADSDVLEQMLREDSGRYRRSLIITEGVFSMDGDIGNIAEIVALAERYGAWTYVDDAHGSGVSGMEGRGALELEGVLGRVDIVVGTLGKAFGTSGAFVAGSSILREYLMHKARSFVFTTATPPSIAAATLEALRIATVEEWRRNAIKDHSRRLRNHLSMGGIDISGPPDGHIIPIVIGDPIRTMNIVTEMRKRGFLIGGVRPPTVAKGTSRLRISVSAVHPIELIDALAANVIDTFHKV